MEPWYKIADPRKEVKGGRSFNPDEFAIALEQVVAGTAPDDYRKPDQFFSRTCFTRALREHAGMVLRRLSGKTDNTAPVLTLITQFGGGKTHTLTTLFHLAKQANTARKYPGVSELLQGAGLAEVPKANIGVFVGNAWDPQEGKETPWLDLAAQLAGDAGIAALGESARTIPPGTEAIGRLFQAAGGTVLILFDEVLNFLNRHRGLADPFYAFIQNLTVAMTGTTHGAAVISLPRSQVEMGDWDIQWQEKITKVVRRVAKDLIANDEAEISEVIRRRLFEDIGNEKVRKAVAKTYADWCFERRAQLPPEWTAVDTATTEAKSREFLRARFEACYPFHPATLSVFQRKWQVLQQYQQTRGTLAMLAQWVSCAFREGYQRSRREPLITLGSAPLEVPEFQAIVLGQLGESRLAAAIQTDIAGDNSHARALDVDTKGPLRDIHRRVGTAILFESSGGQADKVARLPELRFALGEPEIDTTSIDNAAYALESRGFFISRVATDGFRIYHKATIRKAVSDRRASLDEESEIKPAMKTLIKKEFERGATFPPIFFPEDGASVPDSPRLTLVVMDPDEEWSSNGPLYQQIAEWTRQRGKSDRLYPGALVWCLKKPGRDLREKVELWLAWKKVAEDMARGTLGADFDRADRADVQARITDAEEAAKDEVWASYRFVVLANYDKKPADEQQTEPAGELKVIDLGAGHASGAENLYNRVITALISQALLNKSVGAGYIERNWPPAHKESGAWPLSGLRQSFLNGSLTRLLDPEAVLTGKISEFVGKGDFGLASGAKPDGTYERLYFNEPVPQDEVSFDADVFLLTKARAEALRQKPVIIGPAVQEEPVDVIGEGSEPIPVDDGKAVTSRPQLKTLRLSGTIPPEVWNRLGTKLIPKLKTAIGLQIGVNFSVTLNADAVANLEADVRQVLKDLDIADQLRIT